MSRLIYSHLSCAAFAILASACGNVKSGSSDACNDTDTVIVAAESVNADQDSSEAVQPVETDSVSEDDADDFIAGAGNIKVKVNYSPPERMKKYGDDVGAKDESCLVRYIGDEPKEYMMLAGPYTKVWGDGKICRISAGIDTVSVYITKPFGKSLNLRYAGEIPGCQHYRLSKHYSISDKLYPTDFQVNVGMPDNTPLYIKQIISEMIRDDVAEFFEETEHGTTTYPDIPVYDMKKGTIAQMSQYYYKKFSRLYKESFSCDNEEDYTHFIVPCYSYQLYAYPVWKNPEKTLETWRFYNFIYGGGAHGGEIDFYLTFDNTARRVMGWEDFYTQEEYKQALAEVTRQLNERRGIMSPADYSFTPDIQFAPGFTATRDITLDEVIDKTHYPRPALTRHGMVFTYQTYEKGSFAEGVLHFTQPYRKNLKHK